MTAMSLQRRMKAQRLAVHRWNGRYRVGRPVRYWTGAKEGPGRTARTRTDAQLLGGHTAVVWVAGEGSCIALSHVAAIDQRERPAS